MVEKRKIPNKIKTETHKDKLAQLKKSQKLSTLHEALNKSNITDNSIGCHTFQLLFLNEKRDCQLTTLCILPMFKIEALFY